MKSSKPIYLLLILIGSIAFACNQKQLATNRLDSDDYKTKEKRIEILKEEIKCFSNITDAEFELFNVNSFTNQRVSVPGASLWDYKFVVKIDPKDIPAWTANKNDPAIADYDLEWTNDIVKNRKDNWKVSTKPIFYTSSESIMLVYKAEGIVFKRVITN